MSEKRARPLANSSMNRLGQRQNVLAPLAQRRDVQLHHVQPVKQILAKTAGFDFLLQIAVARGEDARVGVDFAVRADALKSPVLRHAQQLGLQRRRHLGDFIQKNRAAVRLLKPADALGVRAGERALFVPEQFAFQQRFGNGGAVDLDQRPRRARTPGVNDIGHHFLAHAAFAGDEHAGFGRRNQRGVAEHGLHERAAGDHIIRQRLFLRRIAAGRTSAMPVACRTEASSSSRSIGLAR